MEELCLVPLKGIGFKQVQAWLQYLAGNVDGDILDVTVVPACTNRLRTVIMTVRTWGVIDLTVDEDRETLWCRLVLGQPLALKRFTRACTRVASSMFLRAPGRGCRFRVGLSDWLLTHVPELRKALLSRDVPRVCDACVFTCSVLDDNPVLKRCVRYRVDGTPPLRDIVARIWFEPESSMLEARAAKLAFGTYAYSTPGIVRDADEGLSLLPW